MNKRTDYTRSGLTEWHDEGHDEKWEERNVFEKHDWNEIWVIEDWTGWGGGWGTITTKTTRIYTFSEAKIGRCIGACRPMPRATRGTHLSYSRRIPYTPPEFMALWRSLRSALTNRFSELARLEGQYCYPTNCAVYSNTLLVVLNNRLLLQRGKTNHRRKNIFYHRKAFAITFQNSTIS